MNRAKLTWFALRFPRDLEPDAAIAALTAFSGLPFRGYLVLDLSADHSGIRHGLGVTRPEAELVIGALRAAIPSLRLRPAPDPERVGHSLLVQMTPGTGALRTDSLAATSAALLASLFPLAEGEAVRLRWRLRSAPVPSLPQGHYEARDGSERALRAKLIQPGLGAAGELFVRAGTRARRRELTRRIVAVLWSLRTPYGRLSADPHWLGQLARPLLLRGQYLNVEELAAVIAWPVGGPDLPGLTLGAAKRLVPGTDLSHTGRVLGTSDFSGLTRPVALSERASTRGLYVLGPTGTGKTSLLKNLIHDDLNHGQGVAVIETNGDLITEIVDSIPPSRLDDVLLLDPTDSEFAVGFNPFAGGADSSLVADQLSELFQRLWEDFWGPRTARLTHMGLLTLARRRHATLLDIPRLYLDPVFRARMLADLDDPVGLGPDWQWFERLPEREQLTVVAPLLNKVRAFTARPAIRAIVGQFAPALSVQEIIES